MKKLTKNSFLAVKKSLEMASEDEKAFKNCLYDHVDFIKEYILENAQNHDCAEKMRFILSLIVGDQQ